MAEHTPTPELPSARSAEDLKQSLAICSMSKTNLTREDLIRREAYLNAAARNFAPDGAIDDWLRAERQVNHWIGIYGMPHHFTIDGLHQTSV